MCSRTMVVSDEYCLLLREPSRAALERAQQHIAEKYAVTGVLEDMEEFYGMLEAIVPKYFRGIKTLYTAISK